MTAIIKLKYRDENKVIKYITPWRNFIMNGTNHAVESPATEAIREWGGRFMLDTESGKIGRAHV